MRPSLIKCAVILSAILAAAANVRAQTGAGTSSETFKIQITTMNATLAEPRNIFTLTGLGPAKVLLTGGHLEHDPAGKVSASAEILDILPGNGIRLSPVETAMSRERWGHRATRLRDGDVFLCGGTAGKKCDRYYAARGKFLPAGELSFPTSGGAQILLPDGRVLLTGGYNTGNAPPGKVLRTAEIYDPAANKVAPAGKMRAARAGHMMFEYRSAVYAVGGRTPESVEIEKFELPGSSFSLTGMRLPYPLKDFQMHRLGHMVYLIGGTKPDGNSTDRIIGINLKDGTVGEMPGRLTEAREDIALCPSRNPNLAVVFGGEIKGGPRDAEHTGRSELITFEPFSVTPAGFELYRDDTNTFPLGGGGCLVVGGTDRNGDVDRTVLKITF